MRGEEKGQAVKAVSRVATVRAVADHHPSLPRRLARPLRAAECRADRGRFGDQSVRLSSRHNSFFLLVCAFVWLMKGLRLSDAVAVSPGVERCERGVQLRHQAVLGAGREDDHAGRDVQSRDHKSAEV
jgi:hypothetical protein